MKRGMRSGAGAVVAAGALLVVLALPGCRSGGARTLETLPPEPPTTTTTAVDVTKVPAVIDVAYVQAVIDRLDVVIGDAVRVLVGNKGVPNAEFVQLLSAVYGEQQSQREQRGYGGFTGEDPFPLRADPGNPDAKVTSVVDSSPTCIVLLADHDFAPIYVRPQAGHDIKAVVELHPRDPARDPSAKRRHRRPAKQSNDETATRRPWASTRVRCA